MEYWYWWNLYCYQIVFKHYDLLLILHSDTLFIESVIHFMFMSVIEITVTDNGITDNGVTVVLSKWDNVQEDIMELTNAMAKWNTNDM